MKVLLIDPWGTANTAEYLNGLVFGLSRISELTIFTNHFFKLKTKSKATIRRVFFKYSENRKQDKIRKVLRGIEYCQGYKKIISYLKKNGPFDVIHINWLLMYDLDVVFLKKLKRYTKKLVYTAHNVLPHENGEHYISKLKKIYALCNCIVVHGNSIADEFCKYYPEFKRKIYVQKHGCNLKPQITFDDSLVPDSLQKKISRYERIYLFFGLIFQNKGPDRIITSWNQISDRSLLVLAGKRSGEYPEFDALEDKIKHTDNIIYLNEYVDDNTLNYLIFNSDIILLPYRHASMSGVVFTAADFSKTVMCTETGALPEYLKNEEDSFIVPNDDESINKTLHHIDSQVTHEQLIVMGKKLKENITESCSWDIVANKLLNECYLR